MCFKPIAPFTASSRPHRSPTTGTSLAASQLAEPRHYDEAAATEPLVDPAGGSFSPGDDDDEEDAVAA